jgi:hypothetical protein
MILLYYKHMAEKFPPKRPEPTPETSDRLEAKHKFKQAGEKSLETPYEPLSSEDDNNASEKDHKGRWWMEKE